MKTVLMLLSLLIFFLDYTAGQNRDTIYHDKNWDEINYKNFKFYRIAFQDRGVVHVNDYYKTGKIKMTGTYKSFNFQDKTGQFLYYKENGHFFRQDIYEPFKYPSLLSQFKDYLNLLSPMPDSINIVISYRKNGAIWGIGYVSDSCDNRSRWLYISKKGDLYFQMSFINNKKDGRFISYNSNKICTVGQFKNGQKNGEWVFYDLDGRIIKKTNYLYGKDIR